MAKEHVDQWVVKMAAMKQNINGRLVQNETLHRQLEAEMEKLLFQMTDEEQAAVERPARPLLPSERSLIAHNDRGELIGFEDDDDHDGRGGY